MILWRLLVGFICLFAAVLGLADGTYFKQKSIQEVAPSIPFQRALIKYDGKYQSLFIESTLKGPKGQYSWVVPLPKKPLFVKAVKPSYIEAAFSQAKPAIPNYAPRPLLLPILASLLATALFLSAGYRYRNHDADKWIHYFFEGAAALTAFFLLAWGDVRQEHIGLNKKSEVAASAGFATGGLEVEDLGQIGSYRVHVLAAASAAPVMDWLNERSFDVPDSAASAIHDYSFEGWVFLVAQIQKDEDRAMPPHPLKAVVETDSLVYPMRLTGTQRESLRLELVVVGPKRAEVEPLEAWACKDRRIFAQIEHDETDEVGQFDDWEGGLYAVAKEGEVTTYLRADLSPKEMQKDFKIGWTDTEVFSFELLTRDQAVGKTILVGFFILPGAAYVLGIFGLIFGKNLTSAAVFLLIAIAVSAGTSAYKMQNVKVVDVVEMDQSGHKGEP